MKNLFILAMLVLGTGFAQAQTSTTTTSMTTDMDMPMAEMPTEMVCMKCTNHMITIDSLKMENMKMMDMNMMNETKLMEEIIMLSRFKLHATMVLKKGQLMKVNSMIKNEVDMMDVMNK